MTCGVAELLREGGPVRVPLRACCAAALVGRRPPADECAAVVADSTIDSGAVLEASGVSK